MKWISTLKIKINMTNTWLKVTDLNIINNVISQFPKVSEVIIFWSRAMWNYKQWSDIDIALKGNNLDHKTVLSIHWTLEDETMIPNFFDVIDYNSISNKELKKHIDEFWKIIYSKN